MEIWTDPINHQEKKKVEFFLRKRYTEKSCCSKKKRKRLISSAIYLQQTKKSRGVSPFTNLGFRRLRAYLASSMPISSPANGSKQSPIVNKQNICYIFQASHRDDEMQGNPKLCRLVNKLVGGIYVIIGQDRD